MTRVLMSPADWAQAEFGAVESGDLRRTKRLVRVGAALAKRPAASLPKAMEGRAELKAAYRLFGCQELTHCTLLAEHCLQTRLSCQHLGRYLLIEDTTQLDFSSHKATRGLGPIGDGRQRGFLLHTTLAVKLCGNSEGEKPLAKRLPTEMVGVFGQKLWIRPEPEPGKKSSNQQSTYERQKRSRESQRWAAVFEEVHPQPQAQWIYVADRESDIFEGLQRCQNADVGFVIRACQSRALLEKEHLLFEEVARAPLLGTTELPLRARPGAKARTATLELRAISVEVRPPARPGKKLEPLRLTAVEARERRKENKAKPGDCEEEELHWILLTSLPANTLQKALEIVAIYRERWLIEDYHKALKTGTGIEHVQLGSAQALESIISIVAILAVRLLGLQLLAANCPEKPLPAQCSDPEILEVLERFYGVPKEGWSVGAFLKAIARLGGFLGRKSDGNPGWITIWRGCLELSAILRFKALLEKCG